MGIERLNELTKILSKLYLEYGNTEVVIELSKFVDKLVIEEMKKINEIETSQK